VPADRAWVMLTVRLGPSRGWVTFEDPVRRIGSSRTVGRELVETMRGAKPAATGTKIPVCRVNLAACCGVNPLMTTATIEWTVWVEEDEDRLVRFVEADYGSLVAALGLVCGDRGAAEDAVQEALARAVIALRKGRTIDSLPAWVRVVALNLLRNRWRSLSRERRARRRIDDDPHTADSTGLEDALDLDAAVAALPRRQREAVALYYRLDLSVAETAEAMEVSDGTVKTLLSRARAALAVAMDAKEVPQ
jgi:RNA polymerase sigma factor (sigma-70 family)